MIPRSLVIGEALVRLEKWIARGYFRQLPRLGRYSFCEIGSAVGEHDDL